MFAYTHVKQQILSGPNQDRTFYSFSVDAFDVAYRHISSAGKLQSSAVLSVTSFNQISFNVKSSI